MDVLQIKNLGKELEKFLGELDDGFSRSEPRENLRTYVRGQLSDLLRKSAEPIALETGVPLRTLPFFFSSGRWDDPRLRDRTQQVVARDHAHRQAIGVIDETGNPKKGRHHRRPASVVWPHRQDRPLRGWGALGLRGRGLSMSDGQRPVPAGDLGQRFGPSPGGGDSRRGGVSQEDADRVGPGRPGAQEWDSRGGLDVRRVVWAGPGVPRRLGRLGPVLHWPDAVGLFRLAASAAGAGQAGRRGVGKTAFPRLARKAHRRDTLRRLHRLPTAPSRKVKLL